MDLHWKRSCNQQGYRSSIIVLDASFFSVCAPNLVTHSMGGWEGISNTFPTMPHIREHFEYNEYSVHCIVLSVHCTVFSVNCTEFSIHCTVVCVHCTEFSVHCNSVLCILYRV